MGNCCPHCGFNIEADRLVEQDGFALDPRGTVHFQGERVRLSKQEALLLYAVAAEGGRPIHRDVIWGRISSSETIYQQKLVSGVIMQIRDRLEAAGAPYPIETLRGTGNLRWHLQTPK